MLKLPTLAPGDQVEIIAPAARCSDLQLQALQQLLTSWQLKCLVSSDIFGKDLLCANTDEQRSKSLLSALTNPETKAIICARGGYGSMRLISKLATLSVPTTPKLFVGMSDITALHLYLQNQWQWPVVHGALAVDKFSPESIAAVKSILFGSVSEQKLIGKPLNQVAHEKRLIEASITGGNLSIVQAGIGTEWQVDAAQRIIFLEEVGERGYRVDRMLEHLRQAGVFDKAVAIVFGDLLDGLEPDGSSLIQPVLQRFADSCDVPVVKIDGIGHGFTNFPLVFGTDAQLALGRDITLTFTR